MIFLGRPISTRRLTAASTFAGVTANNGSAAKLIVGHYAKSALGWPFIL
jgi:hypothetical protein